MWTGFTYLIFFTFIFLAGLVSFGVGSVLGYRQGTEELRAARARLIAGQRVFVDGIGEVLVLGFGQTTQPPYEELVDYVPTALLGGKEPHQISLDELDTLTVSAPVRDFSMHVDHTSAARFM